MQSLRADDPETLGGHRLLARLGAGGMGTVYLARTPDGALRALKMIRAEYAADPAFRARFRREVRLATGLTGRWVVPVTAADTQAREPWLATAFVPGPALTEAVDGRGPLPAPTVGTLGARLAAALAEVHTAGLVHRDVKPGNILLARDGPRLIDFGIAQGAGTTALTAPDAIIGTPGYLSPEQARTSGGAVGPPSDVFSLGCVLAYAATGRRPFGTGDPAAVLYRTVHEEPDLTGLDRLLPPKARDAVVECLAKDPGDRPTAAALSDVLEETAAPPGDWLPPDVLRLVAERSARALVPPPRAAAPAVPDGEPETVPVPGTTRRRVLTVGGSVAAVLAASGAGAAVLLARRSTATGGASSAGTPTHTLALHADLSGPQRAAGTAQEHGARLAVAAHNARADAAFRLALATYDDAGDEGRAKSTARRLIDDSRVRAVIGPTTTATAAVAAPLYGGAALPVLLVSVDSDAAGLSTAEQRTLCVTRAGDAYRHLGVLDYLTRVRPTERTAVIEDRAGGETAFEIARYLEGTPPSEGTATAYPVAADEDDFRPAVRAALAARPQAFVYAGTAPGRAAACARALVAEGFTGPRAGYEPVMRSAFLDEAGDAAEGWVFEAPYSAAPYAESPSKATKAAKEFTAAHRRRYGAGPGRWAAEAYDAVHLVARAIGGLGGSDGIEPGQIAERLFRLDHDGVAKRIRFLQDRTHALRPVGSTFLYQVRDGAFRFLGQHDEV
ncbi:bifunctional serine/threonine-protein kinase/ABC transporter substrate-binding protein [Streptomyces sp. B93]|uniref:bifunctional serine/threonine-protein kinase/ABC transporter substrate-binding protein n=1 Tax=Streptomyces sp. B93 TaxID=2824875 RepID=UPI001B35F7C0|nr:bifunctional serine/threonine-protein kinase/ABC transporter substrate-binding protein [Streptomyces sp. B93]MBQ1091713.1 ABC transporter substrate-binding protein [Streptomyces sp. B93]